MQASADLLVALQCPQVKTILKTLNLSTELTSPTWLISPFHVCLANKSDELTNSCILVWGWNVIFLYPFKKSDVILEPDQRFFPLRRHQRERGEDFFKIKITTPTVQLIRRARVQLIVGREGENWLTVVDGSTGMFFVFFITQRPSPSASFQNGRHTRRAGRAAREGENFGMRHVHQLSFAHI